LKNGDTLPDKLQCPECGGDMVLRKTSKFKYKDGTDRPFYGCIRYPECKATHGAHPDGSPLGIPANSETKQWRIKAHDSFDSWTEDMGIGRKEAYIKLVEHFKVGEIHIGEMDIEACKEVIRFCGDPI
jgi:ssDNA-binding Zn-finger/Zn-ribbon topoisomerase 1